MVHIWTVHIEEMSIKEFLFKQVVSVISNANFFMYDISIQNSLKYRIKLFKYILIVSIKPNADLVLLISCKNIVKKIHKRKTPCNEKVFFILFAFFWLQSGPFIEDFPRCFCSQCPGPSLRKKFSDQDSSVACFRSLPIRFTLI